MAFTQAEIEIITKAVVKELAKEIRQAQMTHLLEETCSIDDVMAYAVVDGYSINPELVLMRQQDQQQLSPAAQAVIEVLNQRPELIVNSQGRPTKSCLKTYLMEEMKWLNTTVVSAFDELTDFVRR